MAPDNRECTQQSAASCVHHSCWQHAYGRSCVQLQGHGCVPGWRVNAAAEPTTVWALHKLHTQPLTVLLITGSAPPCAVLCCAAGAALFIKPSVMQENIAQWVALDRFQQLAASREASVFGAAPSEDEGGELPK